jgi:cell pole-organizing protein PopZ
MGQLNHEPSMEDILASIKRIIAEDSEAVGARAPRLRKEAMAAVTASPLIAQIPNPVIEQEPVPIPEIEAEFQPEPETVVEAAQVEEAAPQTEEISNDVLELTSPMPEAATTEAPAAKKAAGPVTPINGAVADALTSSSAALASRNAFAALSQLQVRSETGQENSLEGLVSDLLRPMLREWLDRELPALVERLVSAEVARLSGRG